MADGLEQTEFVADGRTYDATLRNHLIHGYLGIDDDTLWSIIRDDIPALLTDLQKLKESQP